MPYSACETHFSDFDEIVARGGGIYEALGGAENLQRALELYQKDLELSEVLARELGTVSAYDDLAVSCYKLATHPATGSPDRRRCPLLERNQRKGADNPPVSIQILYVRGHTFPHTK